MPYQQKTTLVKETLGLIFCFLFLS